MPIQSVDLIYLDPPFNSNRNYNILYKDKTGFPVPEQADAFCDTWTLDTEKREISDEIIRNVQSNKYELDDHFIQFWVTWVNSIKEVNGKLYAYLIYMTVRLLRMRSLLKPSGSLYLHCDPTASHYIKVIMDGIFGHDNFRNEIIWCYSTSGRGKKDFASKHDVILRYSKTKNYYFDGKKVAIPMKAGKSSFGGKLGKDEDGREYRLVYGTKNKKGESKYYKYYLDEGKIPEDWWIDIPTVKHSKANVDKYLGYPTQKPISLLERIIESSCPPNGVVLDPFCGCGTSLYASHLLNRNWIGIDIAIHSVNLVKETLSNRYGVEEKKNYILDGIPTSHDGAVLLCKKDPFQFQKWIIEEVKGFVNGKKTGDKGIDGSIYFEVFTKDSNEKQLNRMILSVKGGESGEPTNIRDLMGTVEREKAQMGGFLCLKEPTKKMIEEAEASGYYEYSGMKYKKCQILSVRDILENKKLFHIPNQIGHREKTDDLKLFV